LQLNLIEACANKSRLFAMFVLSRSDILTLAVRFNARTEGVKRIHVALATIEKRRIIQWSLTRRARFCYGVPCVETHG
jgi:hypothetical protein